MKLIRKIHRYFALVLGLAFLAWVVSGILMLLPEPTPGALSQSRPAAPDFAAATVSPAEAIEAFLEVRGPDSEVRKVTLRPFLDRLVYEVRARRQQPLLIDAQSGQAVSVTAALARAIAATQLKPGLGEPEIERLEAHSTTYPLGPLPVFKLAFDDERSTIAYVAEADGAVRVTDLRKQFWHLLVGFHTFDPLTIVLGDNLRHQAMLLAAVLSLVLVATGYYMEFVPRGRWRKKIKSQ